MLEDNDQIFGIYRAIVTDTSCFKTTGKIKTRISAFNNGSVSENLIDGYDSDAFADVRTRDILTDIMMPFGGGYDYGMFKLPQINSVGLVAFIDDSKTSPIWLGSTANSIINSDNEVVQIDYPSDKDNEKPAIYYNDSAGKAVFNFNDENSFIIKTKTNRLDDLTKPRTMNWSENPVENSFILNSSVARLYHRVDDDVYQEFVLNNENKEGIGEIKLSYTVSNDEYKHILLNDNTIEIRNKNDQISALINIGSDGTIYINSYEDGTGNNLSGTRVESEAIIKPALIELKTGHSQIIMQRNVDESSEKLTINAKNLQINAENVSFGSSGYAFVVSPNPNLAFTLEDGSMLTTADNIRT